MEGRGIRREYVVGSTRLKWLPFLRKPVDSSDNIWKSIVPFFVYYTRQLFLKIFFKTMELNLVSDPSKDFSTFIFWLYYYESVIYFFIYYTRTKVFEYLP